MTLEIPFSIGGRKKVFRRPPLDHIQNFMIFYGEPMPTLYDQLANYQLVILESQLHERKEMDWLRHQGVLVLGYLSILEAPQWNRRRFRRLVPEDFFYWKESPLYLSEWDAYFMDLRKARYMDLLIDEACHIINDKGCSGLFLDTVDDIDAWLPSALQKEFRSAYFEFLGKLRKALPDTVRVQNRGFSTLPNASSFLDGLLWENWSGYWRGSAWMRLQIQQVVEAQVEGLVILSQSQSNDPIHQREANKKGFIHLTRTDYRSPDFDNKNT